MVVPTIERIVNVTAIMPDAFPGTRRLTARCNLPTRGGACRRARPARGSRVSRRRGRGAAGGRRRSRTREPPGCRRTDRGPDMTGQPDSQQKPLVPQEGLEPPHPREYQILSLARLPVPPLGQLKRFRFWNAVPPPVSRPCRSRQRQRGAARESGPEPSPLSDACPPVTAKRGSREPPTSDISQGAIRHRGIG